MLPEVPVMITVVVTLATVLAAVRVNTLVPDVGFVPHVAVTPAGSVDVIASCTLPEKSPASTTLMAVDPEALGFMSTLWEEAESQNPGVCFPARSLIRLCPVGLPQPVTRS